MIMIMMGSNPKPLVHLSLLLLVLFSSSTESLRFEIQSGHTKCISEDIKSNSMTVGKYQIVSPNEGQPLPDAHRFTVRVTSSYGNNYHYGDRVQTGQFAFAAVEAGDYMTCFWAVDHNPVETLTVDNVPIDDWSNVAKKGQVDVMELELKKLQDTVSSIHEEMFYLREKEEEMQELNRTTSSRMFWLSLLSLFVCLSVAGMQIWHLKTFFEKKKLI
ncbi:Transmembrane emp24 domain-containing protein 10 [Glycine soja]|uniref:Transmembrane emp24 domain-containing protein 10 n=1 Tax=Glycine soja TaxID=3848 RepID=A0A0B2QU47_GLYSO|nr:Transmembrane emp24 domain-containing protein 10 [Glycine soja]